jgi:hypothetical protein
MRAWLLVFATLSPAERDVQAGSEGEQDAALTVAAGEVPLMAFERGTPGSS